MKKLKSWWHMHKPHLSHNYCILNHYYVGSTRAGANKWWAAHQHPEIDNYIANTSATVQELVSRTKYGEAWPR